MGKHGPQLCGASERSVDINIHTDLKTNNLAQMLSVIFINEIGKKYNEQQCLQPITQSFSNIFKSFTHECDSSRSLKVILLLLGWSTSTFQWKDLLLDFGSWLFFPL